MQPEATSKNQRKLHMKLAQEVAGYAAVDCDINRRFTFDRRQLLDLEILQELAIENGGAKKLAAWIARHYTRIALPDELVKKMKIELLPILENILKRNSMYTEVYCSPLKKKLGLGDNQPKTKECYETKNMGPKN